MALFLNGQRQPLWTNDRLSDEDGRKTNNDCSVSFLEESKEFQLVEDQLRKRIFEGKLVDEVSESSYRKYNDRKSGDRHRAAQEFKNFSRSSNRLVVPAGSTQELRAIIRISGFPHQETLSNKPELELPNSEPNSEANASPKRSDNSSETITEIIRAKQSTLTTKAEQSPDSKGRGLALELINDHLEIGKACAKIELLGEARYHLFTATLIAEFQFRKGSQIWSDANYVYAKFLNKHGWYSSAFKIMEQLINTLSTKSPKSRPVIILEKKVQIQLASLYLEQGKFPKAEEMYTKTMRGETDLTPVMARCQERIAWAQAHQGKYTEAFENYSHLLAVPDVPRRAILSNLGFIQGRLGNLEKAKSFFESALLHSNDMSERAVQQLYAHSGLFTCLRRMGANPEDTAEVAGSLVRYLDVTNRLFRSTYHKLPIKEGPFHFAVTRQLESLLSTCSIPVDSDDGVPGIAFVDADPLDCHLRLFITWNALLMCHSFQFRFLVQCQKHINERQEDVDAQRDASERIKAACQGHLVWVFKIAKFRRTREPFSTWELVYPVSGNPFETENASDEPTTSRCVEGAFHFSKLWLYLIVWSTGLEFVLDMLHSRLHKWLSYLQSTQHMSNLWVERQDLVILNPYDSISSNSDSSYKWCPRYHLSDFTALWLALKQLGELIDSIERLRLGMQEEESVRSRLNEVRQTFDDYQQSFNIHDLRSNILTTFLVPKQGEVTSQSITNEKVITISKATGLGEAPAFRSLGTSDVSRLPNTTGTKLESPDHLTASGTNQAIIASRRTINDYIFMIQPEDITTIEAATASFFENSRDHVYFAWQETLNVHKDMDIASFQDPRQIALTLFAAQVNCVLTRSSKREIADQSPGRLLLALYDSGAFAQKIVGDAPQPMRSWSAVSYETLSILMGTLFAECRPES
ncbi:MAG: hypothetical protein Q9201_003781 [Fulgogasparrea decipioides]